ncbi:dual specificity protein phosphatase family protein [Mesobacillus foraminis]|uniref:protein-tyrosine phosphatase family protein n=1 Tax=Mesobacillus foraminis TaxID=279826 RepID=UPI001BE602EF|nr:dual specificity protein phosphatase family protein [Mesobacillus foraminis]MBT2756816.1 dual specificity protein phosphatase family protein [Mesobacillus foraminis]
MSEKNYQALVKDRIFIGGADDAKPAVENEKADVVFDLRAEAPKEPAEYNRIHSPIVEDKEGQEESIKNAIDSVLIAYEEGKKVYFHCGGGSNRTGTVAIGTLLGLGEASSIEEAEEKAQSIRPKIKVKPEMKEALKRLYPEA